MSLNSYINSEFLDKALAHTETEAEAEGCTCNANSVEINTERVLILTVDGRTLVGTLLSTDQLTNIVLLDTIERIIRTPDDPEPSSQIEHGLYLIRGDNVVVCGEVDEQIDGDIDWTKVRGEVVKGTKNA